MIFIMVLTCVHCAGEAGTSLLSMTEELAAYLHNQTGLVTPAQRASNSNSDSDSSKVPSKIRQQVSSAETQETATGQVGRWRVNQLRDWHSRLTPAESLTQQPKALLIRVRINSGWVDSTALLPLVFHRECNLWLRIHHHENMKLNRRH